MTDAYGRRLGERLQVENAPAIVTRALQGLAMKLASAVAIMTLMLTPAHASRREPTEQIHLVVLVRDDDRWIILDNRTFTLVDSIAARQYEPLNEFDANGVRDFRPHSMGMESG